MPTTTTTLPLATQAAVNVLAALRSMITNTLGAANHSAADAAAVYILTAEYLSAALAPPGATPDKRLAVFLRMLRANAKNHFAALASTTPPPSPAIGAGVDSDFALNSWAMPAGVAPTAHDTAAAQGLAQLFLAVPAGGFNAAQAFLKSKPAS